MKVKTAITAIVVVILSFTTSQAEWIDDWVQQHTSTSADYLESQKRGFATFGGFSARWSPGSDYLVSLTPPTFKVGCGGIDVFLGGFSFLNADYLVQKLQNMLAAAPAVAFDLALATLCSQCSKTIKALEAVSSRLNQLQFDDCQAAKAGVSILLSDIFSKNEKLTQRKSVYVADFLQSTGLQDMWQDVKERWREAMGKTPDDVIKQGGGSGASELVSACPSELITAFFTPGSLLDRLGSLRGYADEYIDLMRGYVGDVETEQAGDDYHHLLVPPCPENTPQKIDGLVYGEAWKRDDPDASCEQITSLTIDGVTYPHLRAWVFTMLSNICTKMVARTALAPEEEDFLRPVPLALYKGIYLDIQAQGAAVSCSSIADMYADSVAAAYGYALITDLYDLIEKAIVAGETIAANKQGAQPSSQEDRCKVDLASDAIGKLERIKNRLPPYIKAAREQYTVMLTGLLSHKEYAARVEAFNELVRDAMANVFNRSMADRALLR